VSAAAGTAAAFAGAGTALQTVRDLLRFAVSRFQEAALTFGHGTDNAFDEAAYLILHTLHLPLDRLEPFLDARLLPEEVDEILGVLSRRVHERLPAAYITREAWLADHRFYVDERVIVPRSHIAELISERFALEEINTAILRMRDGSIAGRCLVRMVAED
jgi:ribosomal protein L3 glutamine methyltransferase